MRTTIQTTMSTMRAMRKKPTMLKVQKMTRDFFNTQKMMTRKRVRSQWRLCKKMLMGTLRMQSGTRRLLCTIAEVAAMAAVVEQPWFIIAVVATTVVVVEQLWFIIVAEATTAAVALPWFITHVAVTTGEMHSLISILHNHPFLSLAIQPFTPFCSLQKAS